MGPSVSLPAWLPSSEPRCGKFGQRRGRKSRWSQGSGQGLCLAARPGKQSTAPPAGLPGLLIHVGCCSPAYICLRGSACSAQGTCEGYAGGMWKLAALSLDDLAHPSAHCKLVKHNPTAPSPAGEQGTPDQTSFLSCTLSGGESSVIPGPVGCFTWQAAC